jgi:diaminohydroxyphosphoribosylaminopyrimidine deaminase/5-amino-6-(5-phosphoribosylamino)uracil reductase
MQKTFDLALRGKGRTAPNPMVGAIVVRGDRIVGQGFHDRAGGPHAEIVALEDARGHTSGSTLFVNLEPCNHHGNTPPCTDAIIEAGIRRVFCSMEDPNPKVQGSGLHRLAEAGIEVNVGIMESEARRLNEVYEKNIRSELPFVTLKIAQSIDGRIATRRGDSQWITGAESRREVHRLRNECDALLVGIGTVVSDDPLLTVRDIDDAHSPLRVVLDSQLRIAPKMQLVKTSGRHRTLIYTTVDGKDSERPAHLRRKGITVERLPAGDGGVALEPVLRDLFQRGVSSLFVEGGTGVFTSFLSRGQADKLYIFVGPVILGAGGSFPSFDNLDVSSVEQAIGVNIVENRMIQEDLLIVGYPSNIRSVGRD